MWDRDFKFPSYDSLVSSTNFMLLGNEGPLKRGEERRNPLTLKNVILQLLAGLVWKWLQVGRDKLLIIASTGDVLFSGINIDDLEWPWTF